VDFRRTRSEREQTVHQIGKKQLSLRVCSRDLTIPRRNASAMSWISTSHEKPVPKMPAGIYFKAHLRIRKNLSLTRSLSNLQKPPPHAIVFRRIRYFYPLP